MSYILIVDDDTDFASAVSTVLKSQGHETAAETEAEKTIDRIRHAAPTRWSST